MRVAASPSCPSPSATYRSVRTKGPGTASTTRSVAFPQKKKDDKICCWQQVEKLIEESGEGDGPPVASEGHCCLLLASFPFSLTSDLRVCLMWFDVGLYSDVVCSCATRGRINACLRRSSLRCRRALSAARCSFVGTRVSLMSVAALLAFYLPGHEPRNYVNHRRDVNFYAGCALGLASSCRRQHHPLCQDVAHLFHISVHASPSSRRHNYVPWI